MKKLLALALGCALTLSLAACGGSTPTPAPSTSNTETPAPAESDLAYIKDKGVMVIGYTVAPPMNYTDDSGVFTGFDTELATMVCVALGVTPEFQLINWDSKEVELAGKGIDCVWNGMTLTPEREANMACTIPYCKNAQVVVMKSGADYADTASLIGKVVCAEQGSAGQTLIQGDDETDPDPNLAQCEYVPKAVQSDCLLEVKAGTADAAILDMTLANSMIGEGTNYSDLVIVDYLAEEDYGVAFRQGSDVRDEVNALFEKYLTDGTLQTLADKYNLELPD